MSTGEPKEFFSQQLSFSTREECIAYFETNQAELLNGLMTYARTAHDSQVEIKESGCALVDFTNYQINGQPKILQTHPMYQPTSA
tara:strand:- start:2637 stop:2891 length:255 start_codon:yes stop_codon:yes gene_type:complete